MDQRIVKNFIHNLSYQLLLIIVPMISAPYVSRCLGAANVGTFSYTSSVVSYFTLFVVFGFHVYGQREIARVQNDISTRSQLFYKIQLYKGIFCALVTLIYLAFVSFQHDYKIFYIIQLITLISTFFDISYFFQGLEIFKILVFLNGIVKVISLICIFLFIHNDSDLNRYILISCLSVLLGNLSMWVFLPRYTSKISRINAISGKEFLIILQLFLPMISVQIYFNIDKTMLGSMNKDMVASGYYEQALKIIRICQTVIISIGGVLISGASRLLSGSLEEEAKKTVQKSIDFALLLASPMTFGLLAIADIFIPLYFGDDYLASTPIVLIMAPILMMSAISNTVSNGLLIPLNRQNFISLSTLIAALVNVLLNFALIPSYSIRGAAVATVFTELCVLILVIYFARDYIFIGKILFSLIKYLLFSFIMYMALNFIKPRLLSSYSILRSTFELIIIGMLVYGFIYLLSVFITRCYNKKAENI